MKIIVSLLLFLFLNLSIFAQTENVVNLANSRTEKAIEVFNRFTALGVNSLPFELFQKAKAVAVFSEMDELKLLLSKGMKGRGLLTFRNGENWSLPTFLVCRATGFEVKIADKNKLDSVFLFMDDKSVEMLKKGHIKPGKIKGDKLVLGPLVKGGGAELKIARASIIYYTFEDGKLSGAEFQSDSFFNPFGIFHDDDINKAVFGKKHELLINQTPNNLTIPPTIEKFRETLTKSLEANPQ